jgi:hypothetical protein
MAKDLKIPEGGMFSLGKPKDNESVSIHVNNVDTNVNTNTNIVINRKSDEIDDVIRQTYYLKTSTIKRIKKLSRNAEMGVSEFLQTVLDNVLDRINIE